MKKIVGIEKEVCPLCHGTGRYESSLIPILIPFFPETQTVCPICKGKGAQKFIHYENGSYNRIPITLEELKLLEVNS